MCSLVDINLVNKVSVSLKKHKETIATAESCTGGLLAHTLTNIAGSSDYFYCGVITYSNTAKIQFLDVPEQLLKKHGAVSEEVAATMAKAIREKAKVTYGLATTGIAGPSGGTKNKPVGLVYIALSTENAVVVEKYFFSGNRIENKESSCTAALELLLETLSRKKSGKKCC